MTPAINQAKTHKLDYKVHEYTHESSAPSYGEEAAQKLAVDAARVFKTLVLSVDSGELAVAILPVNKGLSLKKAAKALAVKKAKMALPEQVERSSGYVLGGVSPLGQKKSLRTVMDVSAHLHSTIFVSAGKRGLEIELRPQDLARVLKAAFSDLAR